MLQFNFARRSFQWKRTNFYEKFVAKSKILWRNDFVSPNLFHYYCLGRDFENALKFMLNCNEIVDEPVILNERVAINPNSYTTRNETDCVFEAHKDKRKYGMF